jgi:hypothetical protein
MRSICASPEDGLSRGSIYPRIEDTQYAPHVEIRPRNTGHAGYTVACATLDEFMRLASDSCHARAYRGGYEDVNERSLLPP